MRFCSLGAVGEVTGSCHLVEAGGHRFLLDCGMHQGSREDEGRNRDAFGFDVNTIDAVVLSHAHIDHSGRLPLLVRRGFRGPVWTHPATEGLIGIMLEDAANLAAMDAERARRFGGPQATLGPLYDEGDVRRTLRLVRGVEYGTPRQLAPGVTLTLHDAGHILGSAIVEITEDTGQAAPRTLVFSGDLGMKDAPIVRSPEHPGRADRVILESTYGDRNHRSRANTELEFLEILEQAWESGGNVLIPAFAVGRTQEVLYAFARNFDRWNLGRWRIYLDSPMAIRVLEVYEKNVDLFDPEAAKAWREWPHPFRLPNLHLTTDVAQSQHINGIRSGAIIIAGSGMCNGGRIRHHLRHHLGRPQSHLVFVGYQARDTLGRRIVDGADSVRMFGESFPVRLQVHTVGGLSAHADQSGLVEWYARFPGHPAVSLVHGEHSAREALATVLRTRHGAPAELARLGEWQDV
ncbi:MBL fold metallo-hydrolase RNA specificity domain-containing protein [Alkalisalibacterium limincola]|uniref:MBL fold metallo-hydrolase n=1 Tax=Alkalisalibacterium limincola TaxID=2699169 RepID=A0A5C8KJ36_9GAMM|nr:MBL fold metallo-hydrolase [Alkalisalibacterium limincola]TXK60498.1 MBL fold metallo-hydrolase [Alkalisalibacterium limincola]